ncbi:MAG: sulfatase-like hydrolase/transferase [Lachnospiraceae bacterium]|nr:sulfatase-like hydrolase/transferase [Lachnospiraceae bacterium]
MNSQKLLDFFKRLGSQLALFAKECLPVAIALNLCIEAFSRESVVKPFFYLFTSPLAFLYNTLLICTTLSLAFLFKRRKFMLFLISALWLTVGVTDFVMLQFRTTPFTAVDLLLLDSAFAIMGHYLTPFQIALVIAAIVLAIVIAFLLFRHAKKATQGTSPIFAGLVCGLLLLASIFSTKLFVGVGVLERNFGNIAQAFHTNGLPYCFFASVFGTGISKPASYSEEEIDRIISSITGSPDSSPTPTGTVTQPPEPTKEPDESVTVTPNPNATATPTVTPGRTELVETEHPNFVFLQLESFFDPTYIVDAEFSADPVPTFRRLKESCASGFLTVPSVGAGTANTEFEILTGMNLDFFGPGEYPYKTILKESTCESIAYNLSALGLGAHAIHNNDGTFYGRHEVFSQLGFDTFTPIEYMGTYETTPLGWAKDKVLIQEIMHSLTSTADQDFIYTISVQGHGAYPEEAILDDPAIELLSLPEELSESYYGILYFVNQLYEMDLFLNDLLTTLETYEEEVVLVLYGDHLPTFPFTEETLENGSLFETEYIIWSNRGNTDFADRDLQAYALSAHVMNCYDIHEGLFTRFHQTQSESDTYLTDMELLEYDVLYGPKDSYGGTLPFIATDLQFGTQEIKIVKVLIQNNSDDKHSLLYVSGESFTPYSIVYVNDEKCTTTYINPQLLSVSGFEPAETLTVSVAQIGSDSHPLSFTDPVTVLDTTETKQYK